MIDIFFSITDTSFIIIILAYILTEIVLVYTNLFKNDKNLSFLNFIMKKLLQNYFKFDILLSENEVATYINKKVFHQFMKIIHII